MLTRTTRLTALLAVATTTTLAGAQNPRQATIETVEVADHIYMLVGRGGNIGLCVGDSGAFMIDDQFAPQTPMILEAVGKVTDRPVQFVVNTHWHGDHTGGNENMAGEGAIIVAHENVRVRMSAEHFSRTFNSTTPPSPEAARPVITFPDALTFHWNDEEIHVFHVSHAHTDGDAIIHFKKSDVIHMGDTFFNGMYPFIDVDSGGHVDGVIATADKVLAMATDDTKIIPGHGPLSGTRELRQYRDMLRNVRREVLALAREGKTREEAIAAKPSERYDEAWGGGFMAPDRFVGLVYDSVTRASE